MEIGDVYMVLIFTFGGLLPNSITMKKIATILSLAAIAVACNRGEDLSSSAPVDSTSAGVVHYKRSDLPGSVTDMNETFSISAKASGTQLNYTYRGYAKPVDADNTPFNSDDLAAAAIFAVDDVVFVCWHTNGNAGSPLNNTNPYGGSVAAYKLSGIGQYTFMDRVDFPNHDFFKMAAHKNTSTGNIEVFVAGQRDPDNSKYLLAGHYGATVSRVDYDYINDEFFEPSFLELPLPGYAATDIIAASSNYYVLTGNGTGANNGGGLYEVDRTLNNVKKADINNIHDGVALAINPATAVKPGPGNAYSDLWVLDRRGNNYHIHKFLGLSADINTGLSNFSSLSASHSTSVGTIFPINYERGDLVWALSPNSFSTDMDSLMIAVGSNGIWEAGTGAAGIHSAVDLGACTGLEYDAGLGVMYYSAGESGMWVIAMGEYANNAGPLVNLYDIVGRFVPPSTVGGIGGTIPFNIKDITVYHSRNLALASGDGGVFFVQRDKN